MAVIGTFVPSKNGGWTGAIRTLTIDVKVRLVPNDNQKGRRAPAFRVFAGYSELGAAWRERSGGSTPRDYLSVRLDDPTLPEPFNAALFLSDDGASAQLIWSRLSPPPGK